MACVNVNDKGFKATSKRLNIDPKILEGIIDGYWVANPNLELNQEYPSDQYILNYLRLGGVSSTQFSSLLEYENAHTLWKQKYSNIKNFANSNDASNYHLLVERLFGKANVGVIPRLNKTFDVVVLEPQKNIPSEPIVTKTKITESTEVKEGVEELFESNSKLANEVYEAVGFGQESNYYEGDIKPEPNTVFVFGSNSEGRHGAGAAKVAKNQFGAIYGQGEGLQGNAYALPTKDLRVKENRGFKSISPKQIIDSIIKLYDVAEQNPNKQFKIAYRNTIETSLNGYTGLEMIEMFNDAAQIGIGYIPSNVIFSKEWFDTGKLNTQLPITPEQKQQALQLYSQYLDTVFPNSKVKDIVYHLTTKQFESFSLDAEKSLTKESIGRWGKGVSFAGTTELTESLFKDDDGNLLPNLRKISAIVNVVNPLTDIPLNGREAVYDAQLKGEYDSVVSGLGDNGTVNKYTELTIGTPEQIHILGSKQDIKGFKEFITKTKTTESTEVKEGVSELFESNPELANEVYEAVGFNDKEIIIGKGSIDHDNYEGDIYPIRINGEYAGSFTITKRYGSDKLPVAKQGFISGSIGSYGIELESRFQGKGYGKKVYLQIAKELSKEGITLKSEFFGKDHIGGKANSVWQKLVNEGYAVDKGEYFEVVNPYTPQQKQQAQQLYSQYLDTIFPDSKVKDIVYHGGSKTFEQFSLETKDRASGTSQIKKGIFLSRSKNVAKGYVQSKEGITSNALNRILDTIEKSLGLKEYAVYGSKKDGYTYEEEQYKKPSEIISKLEKLYGKLTKDNLYYFSEEGLSDYSYMNQLKDFENLNIGSLIDAMRTDDIEKIKSIISEYEANNKDTSKLYSVIVNLKNPTIISNKETVSIYKSLIGKESLINKAESVIVENVDDSVKGHMSEPSDTIIVFEPEQIHILGSKQDIEGFKGFVGQENNINQQTTPQQKESNYYEGNIKPEPNTVFVFGSNPEGRHGVGAAKVAREQFGAVYGQGEGLQGNAYALPTKDLRSKLLYSEDGGKTPITLYRGYALSENREAYSIEETIGHTAVDYDDTLKGALYFTSSKEEAQDYANGRTDKSDEEFVKDDKVVRQRNRHYTGDYAKVNKYFISANAKVEHYKDIKDYSQNGRNSKADVIVLDKGTMRADNAEYIVKNSNVIVYDKMLRSIPIETIIESIKKLYDAARQNPTKQFKVAYRNTTTASLNGYTGLEMIEMFNDAAQIGIGYIPSNVIFSKEWFDTGKLNTQSELANQVSSKIEFIEFPQSGYPARTAENAKADVTLAFATDFNTAGEKLTKKVVTQQGKKYIPLDLNQSDFLDSDLVVAQLNAVKATSINIAGNGIYTLKDWTLELLDRYMYDFLKDVINDKNLKTPITLITTGGQTGVDEAGAKAGMRLGIPTKVVAPKGWTFRSIEGKDISNEQAFKDRFNIQSEITQQQLSTASAESIVDSLNDEIAAGTEEILSDREKKIIKDRDAFLNSDIISPTEREYLAKLTVSMFSTILDQLLGLNDNAEYNAESFKELYFPGKYGDSDFRIMSRGAIIKKIGPMTIFNVIKEQFFNPYKRDELSDEAFDILELCYLNFETLLDLGYHKLVTNERISLVGDYNREVNDLDNVDDDNESEDPEIPKSTTEKYNIRARSVSVRDSLSPLIRRALDRIQEKDDAGQVVLDQYGLPKLIDTDTVYNTILSSVRKATTIELMESILENIATINPWITGVLDLIKKEPFRSQFYLNFRKDFTKYSIVKRELDKDGNYIFKTHIINTNDLSKSIISDIRNLLVSDELPIVYNVDHLSGYGVVNMDIVKASKARLKTVMDKFKVTNEQFSIQDLQNLSNTHYAEVSNILQVIGISLNDVVIKNILAGSTSKAKLFSRESSVGFKVLNAIDSILSAIENTENPERYALLGEDKNSVKGFYRDIAKTISDYTELSVESSTYENGKLYYSYTTPSYLGKLILNLKNSMNNIDEFNEFISENYTKYGWFVHDTLLKDGSIKKEHSNEWLRLLSENTQNGAKMRNMLEHKVELHYNNVNYIDLSALDYSVALILEFFSDFASKPTYAWYHVPILADKPSAEYIKFRRYTNNNNTSVDGYEKEIVRQLVKVAKQELRRIKTVRERATLDVEKITNFDKRGSEFQFLDFLNDIFLKGDNRESALVQEYLNDNIENTDELTKLLEKHIQTGMENKFKAALTTWEKIGVLDTHKNPKTDLTVYTYLNNVGTNREEVEEALKNYFYNSFFATTEIIQLTVTDIAYSKDTEDFQKRFAQTHSPALRLNTSAVDSNGERYTKDGKERTMYLADELLTSELVPMVEKIFEDKIKSAKNAAQKKGYTALRDNVIKSFTRSKDSDGINVTDAQAYTTLKGYRKKMGQAGKWTEAMQAAYERINSGNMNIHDLDIVCQPMKPFVYTQIAKQSYSKVMKFLKVPVQNKNSEYVLIMAGAIAASQGGKVNRLKAISEFMDANDIDTIQFGTAVKSGQMGVIDINGATSEKDIKTILEAHTFAIDPTTSAVKTDAGQKIYNEQYVHEIPFEDYGIQQEVPEHLVDAYQLFGSQIRKLILADITPGTIFQVGKDGESMTREQLIDLYQELIAANVEESFNKLVEDLKLDNADIKVKNKAISKLLAEEIRTNSRYGPDLLTACSLNEEGDFVIPLADPSQSYRIQQLMNSIIKSRITKQKIKGGAVVLVSPYGLSNDLKIIFNEDGSVKYFECYMPAYTKELFKDFLDENGQLNIDELPDELRKLIGYRIPTEDKYSMAPLYIKGFLAAESGSAIMLPKEITLLSGSDYDIDKMYVMLPEFKVSRHVNANKFKKAFKETLQTKVNYDDLDIAYNLVVIREGVDGISENTLEDKMNKFYLENKSKFTDVKYEKVKYNPNQSAISQSVEARNNRIIDLMYSILTNKDTADKIFNPGSFDVLKKTSRIIIILKNSKQYTYEDLKDLSLDELKDIVKKHGFVNTRSILDPTTQVAFHQQNTTAGKLIGVFANHNSSHAIMQLQDARFNMQKEIVFDGTSFKDIRSSPIDVLGAKLDNVYALDGFTYISKNNAGYLAASVDAVKDPVLNHMNLNTYTVNVAMVLSRMGYDSDSIGLFLTLPAIERVTQLYFKLSNEGYISSDNPVNAEIAVITEKLGGLISEEAISENLAMSNFTKAELANHLNAEETSEELLYQLETLVLFKELLKMGSSLNELTFLTKYDTVSNAVGPTIADSLAKLLRVSKFLKGADKEKAPFTPGTYAVFEKSPMLNAFYVYSNQASRLIFQDNFPHFLADFIKALEILRDSTKSDINVLTVNRFINDFIAFKLTKEIPDGTVFKSGRADRQRFLLTDYKDDNGKTRQGFIGWFTLQVADNPTLAQNPLIRVLTVKEKSKHNPIRSLVANVTGLSSDAIETVKNGWSDLVRNPETKELALALFNYNFYKSGFSFSPTSFMHLAPNDVKIAATAYISSLRPNTTNSIFEIDAHKTEAFVNLFKRNNGHDKRLVPSVDSTQIKYSLLEAEDETLISFDTLANAELDKIIVSDYDSRVYSDIITITQLDKNKNVVESMYMNVSENNGAPIYLKISPLGIKNGALEYSYETSHVDYSIIPDNLKPKLVTGNPDNISGMDVQTMEKVYKEHSGIIEKITATVSNMSTEDIQKILGNTHHQLSKVIKVLRKAYPEFEKTFDSATKSKLIKYLTNALLKDASGVKIC